MRPAASFIDCDVHASIGSIEELVPYLSQYWREQVAQTGFKGPQDTWYPAKALAAGRSTASYLETAEGLEHAIVVCDYAVETLHNPDAAAALASAVNEWLSATWLARDPRLRASIVVPSQFPDLAAAEIDRMANRPGFVQVLLPVRSEAPYGSRNFRRIFERAAHHGLPIGLHFGGAPGTPSTPVGWPSFFIEEYAGMSSIFQTQVISLICGGVLDSFPDLKIVLLESGVSWLPAMLWRFDKNWKGLRREIPWVRSAPSEYVRRNMYLTASPLDLPEGGGDLASLVGQLGGDHMLLYSSDTPHDHGQPSLGDQIGSLPADLSRKIFADNARSLYRI